jgi:hypothetical protein
MIPRTLLSWFLDCQCDFLSGTGAEKEHSKPSIAGTGNRGNTAARDTLNWTHKRIAQVLGVGRRTPYRYASGDVHIPEPAARLLRLLVVLHFTFTGQKFERIVKQIG